MKRLFLLLLAGLFLGIFVLSSNREWMQRWVTYRTKTLNLPFEKYDYGDLYGLSNLSNYKAKAFSEKDVRNLYIQEPKDTLIELYSICDSYLWTFMSNDSLFKNTSTYKAVRWDAEGKQFYLRPDKTNILLIEMVERRVRYTLPDTSLIYKHLGVTENPAKESTGAIYPVSWLQNNVFNKNIEQNLEFNLFDYPFFTFFKEIKANLNHSVFDRVNNEVVVSQKRHQLYFAPTIDSTNNNSSFNYLPAQELDMLVANLNHIRDHYRRAGFTEVYVAIMPNPVTILEPDLGTYNGLLPRLQQHPSLQTPVIDVYTTFRSRQHLPLYQTSDTHWAKAGFLTALTQIDSVLATHSTPKSPPAKARTRPY